MTVSTSISMSVRALAVAVGWLLMGGTAPAQQPALVKKTHTYKTVGKVAVQADVYRPDDAKVRPVLVWIHGGALISCSWSEPERQRGAKRASRWRSGSDLPRTFLAIWYQAACRADPSATGTAAAGRR